MRPTARFTATRRAASSTAITTATATCRCSCSTVGTCWQRSCGQPTSMRRPAAWRRSHASWRRSARAGRERPSSCAPTSGFCRDNLMSWCEANGVHFVLGLARNERLVAEIAPQLAEAARAANATGRPARVFKDFVVGDTGELEPRAARRRQGRVDAWRGQSALHRDIALGRRDRCGEALRAGLLPARRDGEPDQGVPARLCSQAGCRRQRCAPISFDSGSRRWPTS